MTAGTESPLDAPPPDPEDLVPSYPPPLDEQGQAPVPAKKAPVKAAAKAEAKAEVAAPAPSSTPDGEGAGSGQPKSGEILVHFLADGLTIAGKVWYKGEELRSTPGDRIWSLVTDKSGNSLLNLDEDEQWDRWGEVKYAQGPWPGRGYDPKAKLDPKFVDPQTKEPYQLSARAIAELEAENKKRGLKTPS